MVTGDPPNCLRADDTHVRELVGEHYDRVTDGQLGVANPAIGTGHVHPLFRPQNGPVEIDRLSSTVHVEVRRHSLVSVRNRLDHSAPQSVCPALFSNVCSKL